MIFIVGFVLMFFFALWFFINRDRSEHYTTAFLVGAITALSYAVLLEGSITSMSASGGLVYYTRWFFYIASCSFLMVTITKFLGVKKKSVLPILILNGLVMLSGGIAAVVLGPVKWIIFALGVIFFIAQISLLYERIASKVKSKLVLYYILFGWALFPVVFVFAPEGFGLINNFIAATLFLLLDIFTKIIFYLHLTSLPEKKKK